MGKQEPADSSRDAQIEQLEALDSMESGSSLAALKSA